jgi:hypothetical protein
LKSPLSFFGLHPKNKLDIHEEIFNLLHYANGGFTFIEVYNLPITLRRFYLKRLNKEYEDRNTEVKKQQQKIDRQYKSRK